MTEIEYCQAMIKELMPDLSEEAQAKMLNDAVDLVAKNPDTDLPGMVKTLCGMKTLEKVPDESQISPHQRDVIFGDYKGDMT